MRRPRDPGGGLRREQLGHRGLGRDVLAGVHQAGGAVAEQAGGVDAGGHVGEAEADGLVLADRLAERVSGLGVLDGVLEGGAGDADRGGGQVDAGLVEGVHEAVEALALLAQQAVGRDRAVLQEHLGVDDGALAHLAHRLAEADAGVGLLDHEGGDALGAGAGSDGREDHVVLGDAAVRDPGLLAVQDVLIAGAHGGGGHGGRVGADAGLGRGQRGERRLRRRTAAPASAAAGRACRPRSRGGRRRRRR